MAGKGAGEKGYLDFTKFLLQQDEYLDYGKKTAQKIFETLTQNSAYGLDRFSMSANFGKDTFNITYTDHDLVIFVNDEEPPFEDVCDDFEQILKDYVEASDSDKEQLEIYRKSKYVIGLNFNGFKMNLQPASNYVDPDLLKKQPTTTGAQQAFGTLQKLEKDSSKAHHYSSSLCESHFEFMSKQSIFVQSLVRLCKFWDKSLLIPQVLNDRSKLIELIAVHVGVKEEKNSKKVQQTELILKAFRLFLDSIIKFHDLTIEFKDFDPLKSLRSKGGTTWKPNPPSDLKSPPYIIEPANCYNNLAKATQDSHVELYKKYAVETLSRLDKFGAKDAKKIYIDSVFLPQPSILPFKTKNVGDFFKKAEFIFDVEADGPSGGGGGGGGDDEEDSEPESEEEFDEGDGGDEEEFPFCPVLEVNKPSKKYTLADMQEILRFIPILLSVISQSFAYSYSARHRTPLDLEKARRNLKTLMQQSVENNIKAKGSTKDWEDDDKCEGDESDEDDDPAHEDYDVNIDMPVKVPGGKLNVSISFRDV